MSDNSDEYFEAWWERTGKTLDPDTSDVPWFDKRKHLAAMAFQVGMIAGGNYSADDSIFPTRFTFANGRVVTLGEADDADCTPCLFIGQAPAMRDGK